MSGPLGSSQFLYGTPATGGQSLRFEDSDVAYLSKTFASAGDRKKYTISLWTKLGNRGTWKYLFAGGTSSNGGQRGYLVIDGSDQIYFQIGDSSANTSRYYITDAVYRDPSAWYHIVLAVDTTRANSYNNTAGTNRVELYVNGDFLSFGSATNAVGLNYANSVINNNTTHYIGADEFGKSSSTNVWDGYMANFCFIDGTALDPTSFGEYDDTLWVSKSDTAIENLTFGTNGFYLPFKQTTEAEGFSTVTYIGNGTTNAITGVGFQPDLLWIKARDVANHHNLYDSVRGLSAGTLISSATNAEDSVQRIASLDASGFTTSSTDYSYTNTSGKPYVAWCWDAGSGSAVSNTDGTITSTVKANTAKGFGIATYTGNGSSGATFGHGLGVAPDMVIVKRRDGSNSWTVFHTSLGATKFISLHSDFYAETNTNRWNDTAPSSSVVTLGNNSNVNSNGGTCVAYSFAAVSGFSAFGSYSGTGSAGNAVTGLGFKPAFIMIKRTDASDNWVMFDNTRDPVNSAEKYLLADLSQAEATFSTVKVDFDSDGFTLQGSANSINNSSGTYIYMAFADTRDATFFGDTSGNSNNWTPNALNNTDVVPDSPVSGGNFATLNELSNSDSASLKEGSLEFTADTSSRNVQGTMAVSSGKWYFEARMLSGGSAGNGYNVGVATAGCANITTNPSAASGGIPSGEALNAVDSRQYFYSNDGGTNTVTSNSTAFVAGDIIGVALDLDSATQTVAFYKNGTIIGSAQTLAHQNDTWLPHLYSASFTNTPRIMNFGQDSSFAGNETPQGNGADDEDFYYTPPSNFVALKTSNLPAATITAPDDYFNTVLYTGNSSTQSITGVGFQPDWTWIKLRNGASGHRLVDSVRGTTKYLDVSGTAAETTNTDRVTSFDSDGFTLGNSATVNGSFNYVAWNWLAGGTAVTNTDGDISSQVSVNTDAGFSIVSWTSDGSTDNRVGHGLSSAPELIIYKERSAIGNWNLWTTAIDGSDDVLFWNLSAAGQNVSASYTSPTATTISNYGYTNGNTMIAYCFHSVEGFSKIGTYESNNSTDGRFVHTGFAPAWVQTKDFDRAAMVWGMFDNKRETFNVRENMMTTTTAAEPYATQSDIDFVSNGFKFRNGSTSWNNYLTETYFYWAFAEAPFKKSNAK